jgi:hypothetical protein
MKPQHVLPFALLLAACPGPDPKNPPRLWLVLDGSEVMVRLDEVEPPHI